MFAHWFTKERKKAGSRKAVAEKLGVTPEQLKRVEEGEEPPSATLLARCAHAGMDVAYILTGQAQGRAVAHSTADEERLVCSFRAASLVVQAAVLAMLALSVPAMPTGRGTAQAARIAAPVAAVQTVPSQEAPLPHTIHIHGRDAHVAINGSRVNRRG